MPVFYVPRNAMFQVDIDVEKFIKHIGGEYLWDETIDGKVYAVASYQTEEEFMIKYKKATEEETE